MAALPPREPRFFLCLSVALVLIVIVYLGVLDAPFLWDDFALIEQPRVRTLRPVLQYFNTPFFDLRREGADGALLYRPLSTLTLAVDRAVHGKTAMGFHLTNLGLHLVNTALLALLARRFGAGALAAVLGGLAFGLLPRHVESVAWIAGRTDLLATAGALGAMLALGCGFRGRLGVASCLGFLAALGKEVGLAVLVAMLVHELAGTARWRTRLGRVTVPGAAILLYLALRLHVTGNLGGKLSVPLSPGERVVTVLEASGRYALMLLDGWRTSLHTGVVGEPRYAYAIMGSLVLLGGAWFGLRHRFGWGRSSFSMGLLGVLGVLPVLHIFPMPSVSVASDRFLYLPGAAFGIMGTVWLSRHLGRLTLPRWKKVLLVLLPLGSLVPFTVIRIGDFADESRFWVKTLANTAARNYGPTLNLARLFLAEGLYGEAREIVDALARRCPSPVPMGKEQFLFTIALRTGQLDEATKLLDAEQVADTARARLSRAWVLMRRLELDAARRETEAALRLDPDFADARDTQTALERLTKLLDVAERERPRWAVAEREMLAGRLPEAERAWLALLADGSLPADNAEEGLGFLAEIGSFSTKREALRLYRARPDAEPSLLFALEDKLRVAAQLREKLPLIRALLAQKQRDSEDCRKIRWFFE